MRNTEKASLSIQNVVRDDMLSEEDEKEQRVFHRIKCVNCYFFDKETKYCREGSIRSYRPPTPDKYHRCENYREREATKKTTQDGIAKIKEMLANKEDYGIKMQREKEQREEQGKEQKKERQKILLNELKNELRFD